MDTRTGSKIAVLFLALLMALSVLAVPTVHGETKTLSVPAAGAALSTLDYTGHYAGASDEVYPNGDGSVAPYVIARAGYWYTYTLNVAEAGTYRLITVLPTGGYTGTGSGSVTNETTSEVYFTGKQILSNQVGDYTVGTIDLTAGTNVLKFEFTAASTFWYTWKLERVKTDVTLAGVTLKTVDASKHLATNGDNVDEFYPAGDGTIAPYVIARGNYWYEYTLNVKEAGTYKVVTVRPQGGTAAGDGTGSLINMTTNETYFENTKLLSSAVGDYTIGTIKLAAGTNVLRFTFKAASTYWYSWKLEDAATKVPAEGLTLNATDCNDHFATRTHDDGSTEHEFYPTEAVPWVTVRTGYWLTYMLNIEQAGIYRIVTVQPATGGYPADVYGNLTNETTNETYFSDRQLLSENRGDFTVGTVNLPAGVNTLKFYITKTGGCYWQKWRLKLIGGDMDVKSVAYGGGTALSDGAVIPRSTDVFKLKLTVPAKESSITAENISIKDSGGNTVAAALELSGFAVNVKLKETLKDGESYTLTVKNLAPEEGTALADAKTYTFTAKENGAGGGTVELKEGSCVYGAAQVTFVTKSSVGEPISGRKVSVTRTAPDGSTTVSVAADVLSGANGVVTVNDTITGTDYGNYTYTASCEYGTKTAAAVLNYVTRDYESLLLGYLKDTTDQTIAQFFADYSTALGIDPANDIPAGVDKDKVYAYFIGKTIANGDTFRELYRTAVYAETINQAAGTEAVKTVLQSSEALKLFGLDSTKTALTLANAETAFLTDVLNLPVISDPDELKKALQNALEHNFMLVCGKADASLVSQSITTYTGKAFEIPLTLSGSISDAVSAVITVSSADMTFKTDMTSVTAPDNAQAVSSWENNVLTAALTFSRKGETASLGSLFLTPADGVASGSVTVSGSITYDVNLDRNEAFNVTEDIPVIGGLTAASFPVTVTTAAEPNKNSGVTTITGGGNTTLPSVKPTDPTDPANPTDPAAGDKFAFTDLSGVSWAEESINTLLEKGIISESENKEFAPTRTISRAEFLKLVMESLDMTDDSAECSAGDVQKADWFYRYVASAMQEAIVFGNDSGEFNPNGSITREDMAVIIARALEKAGIALPEAEGESFADDESISGYAKSAVYSLKKLGVINGVGENRFNPRGNATRAEAAKMIYELIKAVGL